MALIEFVKVIILNFHSLMNLYFEIKIFFLIECSYQCKTCNNGTSCLTCPDDRDLIGSAPYCICKTGSYDIGQVGDTGTLSCQCKFKENKKGYSKFFLFIN
jgi:hypothetical protein